MAQDNIVTTTNAKNIEIHRLFHEAQRRAAQPQALIKHRKTKSLLLSSPNNIIFELFNTMIKELSAETLLDFVIRNLKTYLDINWTNKVTQQAIRRLRREQAIDVRAGLMEAPAIKFSTGVLTGRSKTTVYDCKSAEQQQLRRQREHSPNGSANGAGGGPPKPTTNSPGSPGANGQRSPPVDREANSKQAAIDQIYEHVMWRVKSDNVTQITSILIKLLLDDGYRKGKLKVESYEDVLECFNDWRAQKLIKLYAFGSAPATDQKLVLKSTTSGDLTKWVANYVDGSEKRQRPDLIRLVASTLRDKTKNCIYITNELIDAMNSLDTGAIRCAFLVDRLNLYEPIQSMPHFNTQIEPLIVSGKLYIMSSLSCVEFAPDPTNDACC